MSVIAVTSSRTSPGATSLAAGLAVALNHHADQTLLIEADPAGGVLALRFDLAPTPSLTTLASDIRNGFEAASLWTNTQDLRGVRCVPAPVDPRLARSWIERVAPTLVEELPQLGAPIVIDLGWVDEDGVSATLAQAADTTLVVTRPDVAEIQALLFQVQRLQAAGANVALVTIGDTPNDPSEIATLAGVPLAAVLPDDPRVAQALCGGSFKPSKLRRSLLWRTISALAESLFDANVMASRATQAVPQQVPAPPVEVMLPAPQVDASAEWAPGSLDQLTPEALQHNGPLPAPTTDLSNALVVATVHDQPSPVQPVAEAASALAMPQPSTIIAPSQTPVPEPINEYDLVDETRRMGLMSVASLQLATGAQHELNAHLAAIVGRNKDCTIPINDTQTSRRHGRISHTADRWHYVDLGSRNGTKINGQPCTEAWLSDGDVLTIGRVDLTFQTTSIREMECA